MLRSVLKGFLAPLALCALLTACDNAKGQEGPAGGPPPAPKVTVAKPVIQDVADYKDFSGRFESPESVEIRARVNGYLMKADFKEGAFVNKGDTLFLVDPRPYQAALAKADADVKVAQSRIAFTQGTYDRADALFKTGDISAQIRDQRLQERDQARAEVDRAKAARNQAALDLSYTSIKAPLTGRIGQKLVSEGNLVAAGQTLLTTIVSMDPIYFYFDIAEQTYLDYARAHPEQTKDALKIPASVALSDEKDFTHDGVIDFIDNTIDSSTGTMRARAVLANPKLYFTPGMFGRVRVTVGAMAKAVLIPDSAVMTDQSRKFVYIVDDKGTVASQTIELGALAKDGLRIVSKGLTGDESVIVNGLQRAHDGMTVAPEMAPAQAAPAEGAAQ